MTGTTVIRRAHTGDVDILRRLAERLVTFDLPRWRNASTVATSDGEDMVEAVHAGTDDAEVFIAELDGRPVGCLHILATTDFFGLKHAHISVIATTAEVEGRGVGRELMAHAEEWTRIRELPLLTLNVFAGNTRARRFYEKAGFDAELLKYAKQMNGEQG